MRLRLELTYEGQCIKSLEVFISFELHAELVDLRILLSSCMSEMTILFSGSSCWEVIMIVF
jgi:hypothetical protein